MADVENVSQVTAPATTVAPAAVTAIDIAGSPQGTNGTSPTQEKSSNSHPHDSEYDTASDLEGGDDYDDEEDDMDESLSDDDDDEDDETETEDEDEDDDEGVEGDMTPQEKVDADAQKKVDEDRSNPQYIPKRGTFYEHDDRTAEVEGEGGDGAGPEDAEGQVVANGGAAGTAAGTKPVMPTISSASKTMKKWQPASAVDRWSHDRFDPSEQAPKSRSELVSAYGYDIRTEDAPPKARRRRRYGRGPSKYNRNWEDESAYLKTNNKERKPPKPSDFPALNEKSRKQRRSPNRRTREEKENRMERRQKGEGRQERSERQAQERSNHLDDFERRDRGEANQKSMKSKSSYNRQGGQATVGRQAAMEFKQKNRPNNQGTSGFANTNAASNLSSRLEAHRQPNTPSSQNQQGNKGPLNSPSVSVGKNQHQSVPQQQQHTENYNNKKKHDQGYPALSPSSPQNNLTQQQQGSQQQQQQSSISSSHNVNRHANAQLQLKTPIQTSNLSQRLQQVQNRNDPSHVGSVQMHALATQNQQQQQQQLMQQQQTSSIMMASPQNNQPAMTQPQEQRGPPKRYSSLRRSQHEAQHMADHQQQQLQQLHIQQQQSPAPTTAMLMQAEQAMLQANLMQMYHQENIQAQMQALQVSQQPNVTKQPGFPSSAPQSQPPGPYAGAASTPAAYYVAAPDAYTAATAQATQAVAAAASYAAQQAPPNYLTQQQNAATLAYANPAPNPQQAAASTSAFASAPNVGVAPQTTPAQPSTANYQNYNTVGGTTYFVPPHTQSSNRPVSLPQRRPTNAIPILPPSEKNKSQPGIGQKPQDTKDDAKSSSGTTPAIGSAENIDHIIDNMFVQRPAFQPPANTAGAPAVSSTNTKSISNEQMPLTSATENSNASTALSASSSTSSQDNTHQTNDNLTSDANPTTTTTESSNNNPISTQE